MTQECSKTKGIGIKLMTQRFSVPKTFSSGQNLIQTYIKTAPKDLAVWTQIRGSF